VSVYTLGTWQVKPGEEQQFVDAWREMATRTAGDFPGATAVLLRDRDDPTLFISVGPWESTEQIERWRGSETFSTGVGSIRAHLTGFQPHTMDPVVTIGG
jgi:heme-degrading monooxygenase HmoA